MRVMFTLALSLFFTTSLAGTYTSEIAKFYELYEKGKKVEAVDSIYSTNPWMSSAADSIHQIKTQLENIEEIVGNYNGKVLIDETSIKDRFVHVTYMTLYDRQPVRMEFQFYRPEEDWIVYSFSFDINFDDEVESEVRKKIASGS